MGAQRVSPGSGLEAGPALLGPAALPELPSHFPPRSPSALMAGTAGSLWSGQGKS